MIPPPLTATLFPYTTLFRSRRERAAGGAEALAVPGPAAPVADRSGGRPRTSRPGATTRRSEEHTSELQSRENLVCRLLLEKKKIHSRVRCNGHTVQPTVWPS